MVALRLLTVLLALLSTGCIHHLGGAKKPSHGWDQSPADCAELRTALVTRPVLRIIACHSRWYGDHAALFVGSPSGIWAFWDPAGWLADDYKWKDRADVLARPFDLQFYFAWRSIPYDGLDMMVFEWDISEAEAQRLHRELTCYGTDTWAGLCSINVCNFIERRIPYICAPPFPFSISPGVLGELLWSQNPSRVVVFRKNCPTTIWTERGKRGVEELPPVPVWQGTVGVAETVGVAGTGTGTVVVGVAGTGTVAGTETVAGAGSGAVAAPAVEMVSVSFHTSPTVPAPGTLLRLDEISPTGSR